jgi:hypothetical protein
VSAAVKSALVGQTFDVFALPVLQFAIAQGRYEVALGDLNVGAKSTPERGTVLIVTGLPTFSKVDTLSPLPPIERIRALLGSNGQPTETLPRAFARLGRGQ